MLTAAQNAGHGSPPSLRMRFCAATAAHNERPDDARRKRENVIESLREKVEAAIRQRLELWDEVGAPGVQHQATDLTAVVFAALAGARPCVTCGKGIGPAKVAKGYVQCYGCSGRGQADQAEMHAAHVR